MHFSLMYRHLSLIPRPIGFLPWHLSLAELMRGEEVVDMLQSLNFPCVNTTNNKCWSERTWVWGYFRL